MDLKFVTLYALSLSTYVNLYMLYGEYFDYESGKTPFTLLIALTLTLLIIAMLIFYSSIPYGSYIITSVGVLSGLFTKIYIMTNKDTIVKDVSISVSSEIQMALAFIAMGAITL